MAINKRSGKTSSAAKNRYNSKTYYRISVFMPIDQRDTFKQAVAAAGQSVNAYINQAIDERMGRDNTQL